MRAEKHVVGVTKFCNYPEDARRIENVGGLFDPDLEKIISLYPDLVIATKDGNPWHAVNFLENAGIPSFVINPRNMEGILRSMESIACVAGAPGDVFERIGVLREKLTRQNPSPGEGEVRVLFLVSQNPMIAAGKSTYIDEMIFRVGGVNVAGHLGSSYPRLEIEDVLSLNPDIVFWVSSMGGTTGKGQLQRVEDIIGSGTIEFIPVDSDIFTRPGPRLFEGMGTIEKNIRRHK